MWMNRNAVAVNGIGASRPGSFVNGTSAYVVEQGVESVLVSESPTTGGDLFRYRMPSLEDPSLDRWDLIGPGLKSYSDQGAGAFDPVRRVYLRTAKMGTGFGLVMWNVATPGPANNPIKFVPPTFNGQFVLSKLHGMDFDPLVIGVRAVERRWPCMAPETAGVGTGLHGCGLDRRTRTGIRREPPGTDRNDRCAWQMEISAQPRRDAGARERPRGSGLGVQTRRLAGPLSRRRRIVRRATESGRWTIPRTGTNRAALARNPR